MTNLGRERSSSWVAGIQFLRGPWPRELVVIGQRAETTAQQFSGCRMAHMREGRIAPDRPAVAHNPQHRRDHDVVERGKRPRTLLAGPQLSLRDRRAVPRRNVDLGPRTRPAATVATARLRRAAFRRPRVPAH